MKDPLKKDAISNRILMFTIFFCLFLSFLWSGLPLVGWSYYSFEESLTTCSVEWKDRSFNVVRYNVTIFLAAYILPMFAIVFSNIKIIIMV